MGRAGWGWRGLLAGVLLALAAGSAQGQPLQAEGQTRWVRALPGTGVPFEYTRAVAQARDGSVLVAVSFQRTVDFGAGPVGDASRPEVWKLGVARYDAGGRLVWVRVFEAEPVEGGTSWLFASALTPDREGGVVLAGSLEGAVDFGGGALRGGNFLLRLDARGRHVWSRALPTPCFVARLAVDGRGGLLLSGQYTAARGGADQAFLEKRSAQGEPLWAWRDEDSEGWSTADGLAVDSRGDVLVAGRTDRAGRSQPYLLKLGPEGRPLWRRVLEGAHGGAQGVAVHGNRVVVVGWYSGGLRWRGRTLQADGLDAFVVAFTREGEPRWARHLGRAGQAVGLDARGGVVVVGTYEAGDVLGSGPAPGEPFSTSNLFVMKLGRLRGEVHWVRPLGFPALVEDVAVHRYGEAVLAGDFFGPSDFGTGEVAPVGDNDTFLLKLAP